MFERGYKVWCERYAVDLRQRLDTAPSDPLDVFAAAKHLGVRVWRPENVPGLSADALSILLRNDGTPSCWSAVTVVVGQRVLVILNTAHPPGRQSSDLAHELAHRIRGHQAQKVELSPEGIMLLSSYDKLQEMEADWLSGCLLLPRPALIRIARSAMTPDEAAGRYGVSIRMLNYRLASTGVARQFKRAA